MKKLTILTVVLSMMCALCFVGCQNAAENSGSSSGSGDGNTPTGNYLTFKSNDSFELSTANGPFWDGSGVEYFTKEKKWDNWGGKPINSIASGGSNYIYLRGNGNSSFTKNSGSDFTNFVLGGTASEVECTGNIMVLLNHANPDTVKMDDYCFRGLFSGCTILTKAPKLPAEKLTSYCYFEMFSGCTALRATPDLPATQLANECYNSMFCGCENLTGSPDLPATTLVAGCYMNMFAKCKNLKSIGTIAKGTKVTTVKGCFSGMFAGTLGATYVTPVSETKSEHFVYIEVNDTGDVSNMFGGSQSSLDTPSSGAYKVG